VYALMLNVFDILYNTIIDIICSLLFNATY